MQNKENGGQSLKRTLLACSEQVHGVLGGGFTETVYHSALERELSDQNVSHVSEGTLPILYKGTPVGRRRPDMFLVSENGEKIVVELKAGSTKGKEQLAEYMTIIENDDNYDDIVGGCLIQFNNSLHVYETNNQEQSIEQLL
ncbi:MAG: hypothetical protein J07AB43_00550 [Candidatus Nanosalina sp. J07AB43]|nr:MAG: hypothetical protein J07AB43_00550 [Candidatus Nanosalina sp. J07AB43]